MALQAALSTIDAWDGDISELLLGIDSDSTGSDADEPKTRKTTQPKIPHSRRRKHEILALRAEERKLQFVMALGAALVGKTASKWRVAGASALASQWERLAATQHTRRLAAEAQNAKLRRLARSQLTHAKRMLRLTNQARCLEQALCVPALPSFVHYRGPSIDPKVHLRDLDALVSRATTLFSSGPFDQSQGLRCFSRTKYRGDRSPEEGVDLESEAVWMLPFDIQRVAETMFVTTVRPTSNYKMSMDVYENTNAMVSQFMATSKTDDEFGAFQGQIAARRLPPDSSDGSILIVMKMEAQSYVGSEARACASFDGWVHMQSVRTPDAARTGPITLVKRSRSMFITPCSADTMSKSDRRKWTQTVVASPLCSVFERQLELSKQAMESILLSCPGLVPA